MKPSWSFEEEARKAGHAGRALVEPALVEKALLAVNHLLLSEPQAVERLRVHAGRRLRVQWAGGASWLPVPPDLHLLVTPAGLLESVQGQEETAAGREFTLALALDEALSALVRSQPLTQAVKLDGDAALATDLAWMLDHLRWDVESDLPRFLPPALAHGVAQAGRAAFGLLGQVGAALRQKFDPASASSAGRDDWGRPSGMTPPSNEGGPSGPGPR